MLERAPKVGDFLMWPDGDKLSLLNVYAIRGEDEFFVTDVTTMGRDILPRSVTYVMTGEEDDMTGGPAERARERAKKIRFATPDEIEAGLRESKDYLDDAHQTAMRNTDDFAARLVALDALRNKVAGTIEA